MSSIINTQTNPSESLSPRGIIDNISDLLKLLPQQPSKTEPTLNGTNNNGSNTDNNNNGNGDNTDNNCNDNSSGKGGSDKESKENSNKSSGSSSRRGGSSKESKENSNKSSGSSSRNGGSNSHSPVKKLRKNLNQIKDAWMELEKIGEGDLGKQVRTQLDSLEEILKKKAAPIGSGSSSTKLTDEFEIQKISKEINRLKHKIPSLKKPTSVGSGANQTSQMSNGSNPRRTVNGLLINPHESESFQRSSFYKEIEEIFDKLDVNSKFFLSCFAVFPENEVVKRRLLIYWWVGEGIIDASGTGDDAPEKIVDRYLNEFKKKGLIEPANKEQRKSTKSYRMHPLVRSAVILLSKDAWLFGYDSEGNLTAIVSPNSRACLEKAEEGSSKQEKLDLEKLNTLFNVNDPFLDRYLEGLANRSNENVVEWLLRMKRVKVLYLGRWQKSAEYHIEVESTEFLKGLTSMKELKLLSLQGICRIIKLPNSIGKLSSLMILDLKGCHNLEALPEEIASLKKLIYMDVSDCYLLDHMPRGLSSLSELQVLKGFVVGNPLSGKKGTLDDLKGLKKLRKLIINASSEDFPKRNDLHVLHQLGTEGTLRKLTIAWGGRSKLTPPPPTAKAGPGGHFAPLRLINYAVVKFKGLQKDELSKKQENSNSDPKCFPKLTWSKQGNGEAKPVTSSGANIINTSDSVDQKLPERLEKLDLHCFPKPTPPFWLNPGDLNSLKKLYIRGGRLKTLGTQEWSNVDTLCLKFLRELKMNWRELQEKFPKLNYLEKVECHKITFCPCDENGVWLNPKTR